MSLINVKVVEDSLSEFTGVRLWTLVARYPRMIHSELMTHRVFSRNASSSRAIPVAKMLDQVRLSPAMPVHWGKNQAGMQAFEELEQPQKIRVQSLWMEAAARAADIAEEMAALGAHKQVVNRILEPFQFINVIVSSTDDQNFFALRDHPDADPTFGALAKEVRHALEGSTPVVRGLGEWHLPFVTQEEREQFTEERFPLLRQISAARCCRVSYLKHDGHVATLEEDLALCERLQKSRPIHASPFEHQATPLFESVYHSNFRGWLQYRQEIEHEYGINSRS